MKGHIRRRGERSWAIILDLDRGPDGKRRQKWHTVQGTKKEAERKLTEILHSLATGSYIEPSETTVGEYLLRWLADYAKINVGAKTYERYDGIVRNDLIPALGSIPLLKLQPLQIQAYYTAALQSGRKDGKGGLSAQTVLHHHRLLRKALAQAMRWNLLAANVADRVEAPHPRPKEMQPLDEAESADLIHAAEGTRLYVSILLAVTTGLRRGEILALTWSDVDLPGRRLFVRHALEETRNGVNVKEPKSRRGRRTVTLPAFVVDSLKVHKAEQELRKRALGAAYDDRGLVCCGEDGTIWSPSAFTSAYRALLARRKMKGIPFHALRHSHASQLLRDGVSPKIISERLGHSKVGFTLDVYSHLLPGMQEEAASHVESGIGEALKRRPKRSA
ncbi:MAG: tyrosine-type recombinase/integrase [Bryobacteraceae bacterium]|jgi:integrase